jgi:hypothetical protein
MPFVLQMPSLALQQKWRHADGGSGVPHCRGAGLEIGTAATSMTGSAFLAARFILPFRP